MMSQYAQQPMAAPQQAAPAMAPQEPDMHEQIQQLIPQVAQELMSMPEPQAQQTYQQLLPVLRQKAPNIQFPDQIDHAMLAQLTGQPVPAAPTPLALEGKPAAEKAKAVANTPEMMNSLTDLVNNWDRSYYQPASRRREGLQDFFESHADLPVIGGMFPKSTEADKKRSDSYRMMESSIENLSNQYRKTYIADRFSEGANDAAKKILVSNEEDSPDDAEAALVHSYKLIAAQNMAAQQMLAAGIDLNQYKPGQNRQIDKTFDSVYDQVKKETDDFIKRFQKKFPHGTVVDALRKKMEWEKEAAAEQAAQMQQQQVMQAQQAIMNPAPAAPTPDQMPGSTDPGASDFNPAKLKAMYGM